MIKRLLEILNSRTSAIWLLSVILMALVASTILPNEITLPPDGWALLAQQKPLYFRLCETFSTPYLVKSPAFLLVTFLLFLSTLVCTVNRLSGWWRYKISEFTTERAFSFAVAEYLEAGPDVVEGIALPLLRGKGWDCAKEKDGACRIISGRKGIRLGFWGSIIFHGGLLLCFLAVPISVLTGFSGQLVLTEGMTLPLREAVDTPIKADVKTLPSVNLAVENLHGQYAKGRFKVQFGGDLVIGGKRLPFSVNQPGKYVGLQFSLQEFGFSPHLVLREREQVAFDYFLNLRHGEDGDYFPLNKDMRLFVLLFPDFIQQGNKIGSRTRELKNPVLLVRIDRDGKPIHQGLVKIGASATVGDYQVQAPEVKNWVNLTVSREYGLIVLIAGMIVGIGGLFIRFLSNERCLTLQLSPQGAGTTVALRGYSRYYPAFLEKEVQTIAQALDTEIER
ncbi:cytochrome c biogenesis protein ResB [Geotalea sp. SG265]|uniref:cytochrome c biogenesis protein ResB n=1 Tax=Geotalea sp. SG265 TaxID=2922867 RepID=UPI001FAEFC43|nr:cytochrome c biogenesis protein ResB [Geotalea sp. SG265]